MNLLLGSFLLAGVCRLGDATDIPVMPNFNNQKLAGNWYPLANIVIEKQFPQYTLKAEPKGGLMYTFKSLENGQCKTRQLRFAQYQKPGKFKTSSPTFTQIVDTDYETYMIIYFTRGMDTFLTLEGRQQNITPDLETKFKNVAASVGITGEVVPVVLKGKAAFFLGSLHPKETCIHAVSFNSAIVKEPAIGAHSSVPQMVTQT